MYGCGTFGLQEAIALYPGKDGKVDYSSQFRRLSAVALDPQAVLAALQEVARLLVLDVDPSWTPAGLMVALQIDPGAVSFSKLRDTLELHLSQVGVQVPDLIALMDKVARVEQQIDLRGGDVRNFDIRFFVPAEGWTISAQGEVMGEGEAAARAREVQAERQLRQRQREAQVADRDRRVAELRAKQAETEAAKEAQKAAEEAQKRAAEAEAGVLRAEEQRRQEAEQRAKEKAEYELRIQDLEDKLRVRAGLRAIGEDIPEERVQLPPLVRPPGKKPIRVPRRYQDTSGRWRDTESGRYTKPPRGQAKPTVKRQAPKSVKRQVPKPVKRQAPKKLATSAKKKIVSTRRLRR